MENAIHSLFELFDISFHSHCYHVIKHLYEPCETESLKLAKPITTFQVLNANRGRRFAKCPAFPLLKHAVRPMQFFRSAPKPKGQMLALGDLLISTRACGKPSCAGLPCQACLSPYDGHGTPRDTYRSFAHRITRSQRCTGQPASSGPRSSWPRRGPGCPSSWRRQQAHLRRPRPCPCYFRRRRRGHPRR